ncbi:MAG TPA: nuclease-related domain-containing protein [Candidatus Acidoferrales bacterium]|jgi:hypothetical protein|nr:nuclease-related domain-containing protein [Candidatus Acidoferrales bacterium]
METTAFWGLSVLVVYPALFMGALGGFVWWDKRKRGTRKPFGEDAKLLRMPGEHLWRRVNQKDMTEMQWTVALMLVPIITSGLAVQIATRFYGKSFITLVIGLIVFLVIMVGCVMWLAGRLERREREYLGFFGERFVADSLEPLKVKGWFIFHDVPFAGETGKFNVDHVAVGPGGIWAIDTKVRRRGRARRGRDRYKVLFDGTKISWPRWDDTKSVRQAAYRAHWLQSWLQTTTGNTYEVSALVAIPGYKVESGSATGEQPPSLAGVRVAEPKDLENVLVGHGKVVLSAEEIKTVQLQLAAKCRDVEY